MDAKGSLGEPRLLISRGALLHNVRVVRGALRDRETTRVCAIIKADAYGHGLRVVADALCNFSSGDIEGPAVDALAVASIDEAAVLPADCNLPILIFRPLENIYLGRQRQAIELAVRRGWILTLCTAAAADDLARLAIHIGRQANVQVMVDTGMTRSGVCVDGCAALLHKVRAHPSLRLAGVCTHFARAEETDSAFTRVQFLRFVRATQGSIEAAPGRVVRHAANSAGLFLHPSMHLDMVRPGLALYGIDPTGKVATDRPLRPVMKWTAPLVSIQEIGVNVGVGYGQTWRAERDTRVGLVPVGYADGYPRCLTGRAVVMVHGRAANVIGQVSMDLLTIDLTEFPHVTLGDEVTLLDNDPLSPASVYEWAKWANTIPYEVLCRIGPRIRRVPVEPEDSEESEGVLERDGEA